jgi:hypothetical protein
VETTFNTSSVKALSITTNSLEDDGELYGYNALENVADFRRGSSFESMNAPGQWVCWDFQQMSVRLTFYRIQVCGRRLKWWVFEGWVDGVSWTEMDGDGSENGLGLEEGAQCLLFGFAGSRRGMPFHPAHSVLTAPRFG